MKDAVLPALAVGGAVAMAALGALALRDGQVLLAAQAGVFALLLAAAGLWCALTARPRQPVSPPPLAGAQDQSGATPGANRAPEDTPAGAVREEGDTGGESGPSAGPEAVLPPAADGTARPEATGGKDATEGPDATGRPEVTAEDGVRYGAASAATAADVEPVPPPPVEEVAGAPVPPVEAAPGAPAPPAAAATPRSPARPNPVPTVTARLESYQDGNLQSVTTVPVRIRISLPPLRH